MKEIYVVTTASALHFAFYSFEEATKFHEYVNKDKKVSSYFSTIHTLRIYDSALQLIPNKEIK